MASSKLTRLLFSRFLLLAVAVGLMACATTHPGVKGRSENNKLPLVISAETVQEENNDAFQLIEITMENTSDHWVKIDKARYIIHDPANSHLSVVMGDDLRDWAKASVYKHKLEQQNNEMMQAGIIGVGAVATIVGAKNSNTGLMTTGAVLMAGGYGWALNDAVSSSIRDAERGEKVPENHLYHSVSIPSKMFMRRWVLLNKPANMVVKTMMIELTTVEGEREVYAFDL